MNGLARYNIVISGACNSGKSTLLNAILSREAALVSDVAGTTTDPVRHLVELPEIGACRLIDTPGIDDADRRLGEERAVMADNALREADMILLTVGFNREAEKRIVEFAEKRNIPLVRVATKTDTGNDAQADVRVCALSRSGLENLISLIGTRLKSDLLPPPPFFGNLVKKGDTVILVMPQDSEAPEGRLILPQQITIRELLDVGAIPICCVPEDFSSALANLKNTPALVITDSQVFGRIFGLMPQEIPLTSFSILMANRKGDLKMFVEGAEKLMALKGSRARILIAQACANIPKNEDIGQVKLPRLLRKTLGDRIEISWCYGKNLPSDISDYDIVVHCGGCMFTRGHILERLADISASGCSVTNYGLAIAACNNILEKIVLP